MNNETIALLRKTIAPIGPETAFIRTGTPAIAERYDYSNSTTIYTAIAPLGTSSSSTGWTITRYDLSSSTDANAKVASDVSWDNRASGTYS